MVGTVCALDDLYAVDTGGLIPSPVVIGMGIDSIEQMEESASSLAARLPRRPNNSGNNSTAARAERFDPKGRPTSDVNDGQDLGRVAGQMTVAIRPGSIQSPSGGGAVAGIEAVRQMRERQ